MKSALAITVDQFWRLPTFPMWLAVAAAGFFVVILLLTLVRAEKSAANGALTVITLLAIGIAVAATLRGFGPDGGMAQYDSGPSAPVNAALPALSCIDDLAGENVQAACERALFGAPESVAAAVSYAAGRLSRLVAYGSAATANKNMTPELEALRRAIQRDRYGLIAYVLIVRDHCRPSDCPAFRSLTDRDQIAANMEDRIYDGLVARYAPLWNAPGATLPTMASPPAAAPATVAALPQPQPGTTGRPTNADFPSSASIPPVNIMAAEPGPRTAPATANAQLLSPQPVTGTAPAAKKPAAAKPRAAPVQLAPPAPKADN